MTKDARDIQARMQSIRSHSKLQQMQFVDDSARMLDWKEHVRAMPVTALVASFVVGFTLMYKKTPGRSQSLPRDASGVPPQTPSIAAQLPLSASPGLPSKSSVNPLVSAAMSMAASLLLSSGKQFILKNIHSILSEGHHERQSKSGVPDQIL